MSNLSFSLFLLFLYFYYFSTQTSQQWLFNKVPHPKHLPICPHPQQNNNKSERMIKQYDQLVKLILIGGSGVGKSSLLMQFAQNKFTQNYLTTIGVDFRFKTIKQDNRTVKFQIWDTAGQQRFRTITSAYYKGADGIIMVYDITEPSSIDDLQTYWITEAYNYCDKNIKVLLLGNKSDCDRVVSPDRVKKLAEKNGYASEEVSAKTGDKVFDCIKDFGIGIARVKMEKSGLTWFSGPKEGASSGGNSGGNSITNGHSNSTSHAASNSKEVPSPTKPTKAVSEPKQQPTSKESPKVVPKQSETIKISSKKNVPSYQKKCC